MSMSVCLSTSIPQKSHVQTLPNVFCVLLIAVARSSANGIVIRNTLCTSGFVDDVMFSRNGACTTTAEKLDGTIRSMDVNSFSFHSGGGWGQRGTCAPGGTV